jgi:hypothetical protein
MDCIDLSEFVLSACGSYINCDLFLFIQTQNNSYYVKSQKYCREYKKWCLCGSAHNLRLSVAVVNESVKYDFLLKYERNKKQNYIGYKIVIKFKYFSYSEKPNKVQHCIKMLLFLILNEAQHVSGNTPPIITSLKLHKQLLVLHTWRVVGRAVVERCQIAYARCNSVSKYYYSLF